MATRIILALLLLTGLASAQPASGKKILIGIYTPTVEFGTAAARLAYAQNLAKAIEQATGIPTTAQSYATLSALKKDPVDYAIIDGLCVAANVNGYNVLANAKVGEGTSRGWALFSNAGTNMQQLKGKKLAYVQAGCNDNGFIDNAMLESEVDANFWGARVPEKEVAGAVASVSSYKTAQAVFAPESSPAVKGLTKVFDTGSVPNPAFVEINAGKQQAAGTSGKVAAAVLGYGAQGGVISGWAKPDKGPYQSLAGRLSPVHKSGVFAPYDNVRLQSNDVMVEVQSTKEPAYIAVRQHFLRMGRMD